VTDRTCRKSASGVLTRKGNQQLSTTLLRSLRIAEIECLERIFAVPDIRPLSPSDLAAARLRIEDTTKYSRIARGFAFGSSMASIADLNPSNGIVRMERLNV
jgi:hypothetical protein